MHRYFFITRYLPDALNQMGLFCYRGMICDADGNDRLFGDPACTHATDAAYAEIKRLYVQEAYRGCGISRILMIAIEAEILAEGIDCARLEMGVYQPEADALYRSIGYRDISPFGDYLVDPLSQFLEKAPLRAR